MQRAEPALPPIAVFILTFVIALLYFIYFGSTVSLMIGMHTGAHPLIMTATQALPQSDFARLWLAGREMLVRRAAAFGWTYPVSPWFRATFRLDILSATQNPALVWLYPPTAALLGSLFSLLPLAPGFWLWDIVTLAVAAACLRKSGLTRRVILMGLAGPAELHDFMCGQNGALTAGLFVAGLMSFERKPVFGGWMVGLLCIKPQIGLALPLILPRRRYRQALLWCLLAAGSMILLSALVEGWPAWVWFATVAEPNSTLILNAPRGHIIPGGFTVLMMARSFHATLPQAWALQAGSSAASAFLIWQSWRRAGDDVTCRMALTLCLSILMTPYGYIYDLVGFSIGMAAMFERSPAWRKPVYALLWLMSGYYVTLWNETGLSLMPLAAAIGAWMIWKEPHTLDQCDNLQITPLARTRLNRRRLGMGA